jgi:integrase/recombinase XerD
MRVGEIASLSVGDVRNADGSVRAEIRLTAAQTKGRHPRTVFLPQKLRDELQTYLDLRGMVPATNPLFITAGRKRFSANVMAQHFHYLFKRAGIAGASSHSMRRSFITPLDRSHPKIHRRQRRHEAQRCGNGLTATFT